MKQAIFGILGTAIVIYAIVSCLSVYSISSRKNEMENCLSSVLKQSMEKYRKCSDAEVAAYVKQDLIARLWSDSKVTVSVRACDMEQGILSVGVTEQFYLPNGMKKTIQCSKTLVETSPVWPVHNQNDSAAPIKMRFISKKYFEDACGNLVPRDQGGLDSDSRWALDVSSRGLLRNVLMSAEP